MIASQPMRVEDLGQIHDGPHATPQRTESGPYFLNISGLVDGRIDLSQSEHVSRADFAAWTRRVLPQEGDLLFSYETRLGHAALMPAGVEACLGRRMALIRPNRSIVDPRYLLYLFLSPSFQRTIDENTVHGATVNRIGLSSMGRWPVSVLAMPEQAAIAEVLGALDGKIAVNKVLGQTTAALSRAEFSRISAGANFAPLTEVARFVNGKAFTKDATGTGRVVVRIAELNSGIGPSTIYNDIEVGEEYLTRPGDILFAWSGSLTLHRWSRPEAIINQHIFKVLPNDGYPAWLVYELIRDKLDDFKAVAADKATTMGHIQRRHLDEPVAVPTHDQIAAHDAMMQALWDRRLAADQESLALATLRDTLLPHLMSGRLRVRDVEQIVSDRT